MKSSFLCAVILTAATVSSCGNAAKKTDVQEQSAQAVSTEAQLQPVLSSGVYEGTLPCADCEGIQTMLTINSDSTYTLRSEYLGAKDGVFETSGVYHMPNATLIELVTPSSGEKTYYKVLSEGLMLSDESGTVNQGELAAHYILKKK